MEIHFSHASVWPLLSMVNPIAWFAVKVLICVGTVPDLPILNSEVLLMSAPLSAFGGKKVSTLLYWYKNPDTGSHSISAQFGSGVSGRTVVGDSPRLLPAAFASLLFASLSAALRVPALPYAVYVGFVCGIAPVGLCPLLARFPSFDSVLVLLSMFGRALPQCSFLGISCCNEMHGCWHCAAMMASASALLYLSSKIVVQAAAAVPAAAKDENYVHHFLFVVGGVLTTDLLLASAASASEGINMRKEKHAVAASAAALVSKNAHDCSFVSAGIFELLFLLKPAAAFVGLSVKIFMRAVAAPAAAWTLLHVFGVPFAIAGFCHVFVICLDIAGLCHVNWICWNILDLMHWKCVCQEDLARFAPVRVRNKAIQSPKFKVLTRSYRHPLRL